MVKLVREWPSRRLMNQLKEVDQARALTIELAAEVGLVLLLARKKDATKTQALDE
jgi:hypothetical protein